MDYGYDPKFRLIYELNAKESQLDFAIQQAELQLKNVNKKLDSLWYELKLFTGLLIGSWLVGIFLTSFSSHLIPLTTPGAVLFVLVQFVNVVFGFIKNWILIPVSFTLTVRSLALIVENRESSADFTLPPLEGERREDLPPREKNYRSEQKKLIYILSKYYIYQDKIKQMRKQIESDPESMTLAELKFQLNQLAFYEQVRAANPNLQKRGRY